MDRIGTIVALELERRVIDAECRNEQRPEIVPDELRVMEAGLTVEHDVGRQRRGLRAERPHVDVMDRGHAGAAASVSWTTAGSRPLGARSMSTSSAARNSDHAAATTRTLSSNDVAGSTHCAPVVASAIPATTTAREPIASAARCRNAPLRLRLAPLARATTIALPALTSSPTAPTTATPAPSIDCGCEKRSTASTAIQIEAPTRSSALATAATTSARSQPYVVRAVAGRVSSR